MALQVLFQIDLTGQSLEPAFTNTMQFHNLDASYYGFARDLVQGVLAELSELDKTASGLSRDWPVNRMPVIDRNIIRMGLYEIKYCPDIPYSVSINEAVELAKVYGTDDSPRFVNGILGRYVEEQGLTNSDTGCPG